MGLANPALTTVWSTVTLRGDWGSLAPISSEGCHEAMGVVKKHLAEDGLSRPTQALCQVPHLSTCPHAPIRPTLGGEEGDLLGLEVRRGGRGGQGWG